MVLASTVEDKLFLLSTSFKSHEYLARPLITIISPPLCVNVDTVAPPTLPYIDQVPALFWAQHSSDTGYNLAQIIDALLTQDAVVPTTSPHNTPVYPVPKPHKSEWRFTQDLRAITDLILPLSSKGCIFCCCRSNINIFNHHPCSYRHSANLCFRL